MDPLRDSLSAQAGLLTELLAAALEPELKVANVSLATFDLLSAVRASGGKATQADVARRLGVTPPTLSESVKSAVQRGLLEQIPDPEDGRLKRLKLTRAGGKTLDIILEGISRVDEVMLKGLDPTEVTHAKQVLRQAVRNLALSIQGR